MPGLKTDDIQTQVEYRRAMETLRFQARADSEISYKWL